MPSRPDLNDDLDAGFAVDDEFAPSPTSTLAAPAAASNLMIPAAPVAPEEARLTPFPGSDAASSAAPKASPNPVGALQASAEAALAEAGIPRIAIHFFCEQPATAAIADQASRDRRLARAAAQVRPGGLAAAVEYYQNQPTPSLVVVESSEPRDVMLGLLDQLAEVCDPGTKVIVIGSANDIALYRELMRRGVSEYLVPPLQPMQIINAVTTLYSDPTSPFVGRQIAFIGAKGGVGSSTLAHNFAFTLSERMQTNTVIADLDLAFGTAGLNFNQDPLQGVANALNQPDRMDPVLLERMTVRCGERLGLLAAPATLDDDYDVPVEAYEEVIAKIRSTAPFVVLDMPHLWSAWTRRLLLSSDEVVIVATPDLASLRNAKNLVDLLRQQRPNDSAPRLILNQVGVQGRPEIPVKDFGEAMGVPPALVLAFEPGLYGKAANNGQMIIEVGPKTRTAEGLDHLAQLISRREPARAVRRGGFLSALFRRK